MTAPRSRPQLARMVAVAVFVLSAAPRVALAAPNSLCPGFCSNSSASCGSPDDCDGAPCNFLEDCLPGHGQASKLVRSVLPDWARGLNDPSSGWNCGLLECEPEAGFLAFSSRFGSSAVASKDLALPPGRYLVLAEMAVDTGVWAFFDIHSSALEASSDSVMSPQWTLTSLAFEVPEGHASPLQFRLHADGDGFARIRRIVVLSLKDPGVYLRFRADLPVALQLERILRWSDAPPGAPPTPCEADPSEGCLPTELSNPQSAADEWSPWIDLARIGTGSVPMTLSWTLSDCTSTPCIAPTSPVDVGFELAFEPQRDAIVWSGSTRVKGRFGMVVPQLRSHPFELRVDFLDQLVGADLDLLIGASDTRRPDDIKVSYVTGRLDLFDAMSHAPELHTLLPLLGANTQSFLSSPPSNDERTRASLAGLKYRWLDLASPLAMLREVPFDLDPELVGDRIAAHLDDPETPASSTIDLALADFGDTLPAVAFGVLGPAIGLPLAGPGYRAAFVEWLRVEGEVPDRLGLSSLDEALPLEGATPELALDSRPDPADAAAARLWGRRIQFWNLANWQVIGWLRDELEARLGPVPLSLRYGDELQAPANRLSGLAITYDRPGTRPAAFLGAISEPVTADCHAWRFGAWADHVDGLMTPLREASEAADRQIALGVELQAERVDLAAVMIEFAVRGFNWFNLAAYGPRAILDETAGGGLRSPTFLDRFRSAVDTLARVEPLLEGAQTQAASVVMLASGSAPPWDGQAGLSPDELGWHMALSHNAISIDFMREDEVEAGLLENPLIPRRVLIVTRAIVSDLAWMQIVRWVEAGGTLILGPELGASDEFAQFAPSREGWLGAVPSEWRGGAETLRWSSTEGVASFVHQGRRRTFATVGGTTLAVAEDDEAIAVRLPKGRGRVIAIGLELGSAYADPVASCDELRPAAIVRYPENFSPLMRDVVRTLITQGGVLPSLEVEPPLLSTHSLRTPDGRSMVLAVHWTGRGAPSFIHAPEASTCEFVRDELTGSDIAVSYGRIYSEGGPATVYTWDEAACVVETEEPEVVEAEAVAEIADTGCAGSAGAGLAALLLMLPAAIRIRGRRSSDRQAA